MSEEKYGHIVQIIGPVIDVAFDDESQLPNLLDALEIVKDNGDKILTEVQQDIGENTMRTIAMDSTDGLRRGMKVRCLGNPISMPTGDQVKGRLFNVIGESIDGLKKVDSVKRNSIHRDPPKFENLSTKQEVLFTGIKVIDLIEPYAKGGKIA